MNERRSKDNTGQEVGRKGKNKKFNMSRESKKSSGHDQSSHVSTPRPDDEQVCSICHDHAKDPVVTACARLSQSLFG